MTRAQMRRAAHALMSNSSYEDAASEFDVPVGEIDCHSPRYEWWAFLWDGNNRWSDAVEASMLMSEAESGVWPSA